MLNAARERSPLRVSRYAWFGALLVAGGIAFRFWLAYGPLGHPSSDESVVGLMALELLRHGHLHAFYWGQAYGGSLEAVLVAPWLWLFGTNAFALKLTTVLAGLGGAGLTWRVARHLFRPSVAARVGVISLFWPVTLVWYGTKEGGFYPLTAALGLLVVLMALNVDEQPGRAPYWAGLGIATGLGWWMSPNIAYYALPMAAWLVARGHCRQARNVLVAVGGLLIGGAIWIAANALSGFDSLHAPSAWAGSSTYLSRFKFFWRSGLPFGLGLRRPWGGEWYGGHAPGLLLYVVALGALGYAFARLFRFRARNLLLPDLFLIAAAPFVFATFVGNWHLFEGRYTYFVGSMMPILLGRVLQARFGAVVVLALMVVPGSAFLHDYDHNRATIGPSTTPIARALERAGARTAVAQYAIAYQLTFESDERVIAVPATDDRYPPFREQVRRSAPAYVFYSSDAAATRLFTEALAARRVGFRVIRAGRFVAVLPRARYVSPALTR